MNAALKIVGYLIIFLKRGIVIDRWEPIDIPKYEIIKSDFRHQYSEFKEEIYLYFPKLLIDEIGIHIFIDSNYDYDKVIGELIIWLLRFIGRTLIIWYSKH